MLSSFCALLQFRASDSFQCSSYC